MCGTSLPLQLAEGLAHLHDRNIIHTSIKAENVLFNPPLATVLSSCPSGHPNYLEQHLEQLQAQLAAQTSEALPRYSNSSLAEGPGGEYSATDHDHGLYVLECAMGSVRGSTAAGHATSGGESVRLLPVSGFRAQIAGFEHATLVPNGATEVPMQYRGGPVEGRKPLSRAGSLAKGEGTSRHSSFKKTSSGREKQAGSGSAGGAGGDCPADLAAAPENMFASQYGFKSDVWHLALMMLELAVGHRCFLAPQERVSGPRVCRCPSL